MDVTLVLLLIALTPPNSNAVCSTRYMVLQERLNQTSARERCRQLGYVDLAILDTSTKMTEVKNLIRSVNPEREMWIGLEYDKDSADFFWLGVTPLTWTDWSIETDEPNGIEKNDTCVRIRESELKWGTRACTMRYNAICEKKPPATMARRFTKDSAGLDTTDTPLVQPLKSSSDLWCSNQCLGACPECAYFLYTNNTCKLFPTRPDLTLSANGSRGYQRLEL